MKTRTKRRLIRIALHVLLLLLLVDVLPYAIIIRASANPYISVVDPTVLRDWDFRKIIIGDNFDTMNDYRSQLVNIIGGSRVTTDQPAVATRTIGLFGPSTVLGYLVADRDTIASRLQSLLPSIKVENYGLLGSGIALEYQRLRSSSLKPGDTAIFYDGVGEAGSGVFRERFICTIPLGIFQLGCRSAERKVFDPQLAQESINLSQRYIAHIKQYCEAHGIVFIHIIEPQLYSMTLTAAEQAMMQNYIDSGWGSDYARYDLSWSLLRDADPQALDFTHILDTTRQHGATVYIDFIHLNAAGNEIVARAIFVALDTSRRVVVD